MQCQKIHISINLFLIQKLGTVAANSPISRFQLILSSNVEKQLYAA